LGLGSVGTAGDLNLFKARDRDDRWLNVWLKCSDASESERVLTDLQSFYGSSTNRKYRIDDDKGNNESLQGCHFFKPAELYVM